MCNLFHNKKTEWFQASAAMQMVSAFVWDIMQRWVVITRLRCVISQNSASTNKNWIADTDVAVKELRNTRNTQTTAPNYPTSKS
jgi:hypothetical protein